MLLGGKGIGDERYYRWQTFGIRPTGCESGGRAWRENISGYENKANQLRNAFFHDRPSMSSSLYVLVRSAGGWSVVKAMRRGFERMKGDERILGDGDFVETVLKKAQEDLDRKSQLGAAGYSFDWLVGRVAVQLGIEPKDVLAPGKYPSAVKARSLLCYWGVRELGMTTVGLARRLNLAQPTVSQAVRRGQKIAEDLGLNLLGVKTNSPMDVP